MGYLRSRKRQLTKGIKMLRTAQKGFLYNKKNIKFFRLKTTKLILLLKILFEK
jgi:hypothetical protein